MIRYAFSIDLDRCIGCKACIVACNTGNELPPGNSYITITDSVRGQMPHLVGTFLHNRCFHCTEAACVTVCPTGTLSKWNGLTTVTPEKCSGCGYCTDACPYKVPVLVDGHVTKCVACLDLVREGQTPWCARTCPSQAIKFGKQDKLLAKAQLRVAILKTRFPNAQVYGKTQFGSLGLLTILPDKPEVFGFPEAIKIPPLLGAWQSIVQPFSLGISALSVIVTGLSFIIARRRHLSEHANLNVSQETGQASAEPAKVSTPGQPAVKLSSKPIPLSISSSNSKSVPKSAAHASPHTGQTPALKHVAGKKAKPAKPPKSKNKRGK
jgi:formate dehydrogenase iron-sulfur subunit